MSEWLRNDLGMKESGDVSYKRQHPILSFWPRESCIASAWDVFLLIWNWNEIGMTKWPPNEWNDPMKKRIFRWNDGMKPNSRDFRIKGFAFVQKSPFIWPHSVIPKWLEWSGNDQNDCWMISTHCNFDSSSFKNDINDMEWRNEVEWRGFRRRRKKWILRCLSFRLIPSSRPHSEIQK